MWLVFTFACFGSAEPGDSGVRVDCAPGEKGGSAQGSDDRRTPQGLRYTVRVPEAYDATVAHPLVVVYAPAGGDPELTESFTALTGPLTRAGYLVAYADHVTPSNEAAVRDLGTIPRRVARRWCVDEDRVHFTGHSDGGSVASMLALFEDFSTIRPASIAPSAAGVSGAWLEPQTCPDPLPVMVMHSSRDGLFPGFGQQAANWWASCNGCGRNPGEPDRRGCQSYPRCPEGAEVTYCEYGGSHGTWPDINRAMVGFFDASAP